MTKSEQRLLSVLFILIITFATLIIIQISSQEQSTLLDTITRLENKYESLRNLQRSLIESLSSNEEVEESIAASSQFFSSDIDIYESGSELKEYLNRQGLDPKQFSVNEELNQIEFSLQTSSWSFLRVLEEIQNQQIAVRYDNINIRRLDDGTVQGLVRLSYAKLPN